MRERPLRLRCERLIGRSALVVVLSMMLTACGTTPTVATDAMCRVLLPISFSSRDTDETVAQVREFNAVWRSLCEEA